MNIKEREKDVDKLAERLFSSLAISHKSAERLFSSPVISHDIKVVLQSILIAYRSCYIKKEDAVTDIKAAIDVSKKAYSRMQRNLTAFDGEIRHREDNADLASLPKWMEEID